MPLSKMPGPARGPKSEFEKPAAAGTKWPPRRISLVGIIRDESGSMSPYRNKQGGFIPKLLQTINDELGTRTSDLVGILYAVVSGGVAIQDSGSLTAAKDPDYQSDGDTPLGTAFLAVADKVEEFFKKTVFPGEITIPAFEFLVLSDLFATGETSEQTMNGVNSFIDVMKKYRATVRIVVPNKESYDRSIAALLDLSGKGVSILDETDPTALFRFCFDSVKNVSRRPSGSRRNLTS